ncbi:MAG: hypothetical protein ACK41C_19200 [Phenylobacterium sp.]|jgi:hypothetical protein|uniref:hypothetical protein n=1 Tax=Phenylobacterium sp. TaxID=1871053 RepID=UPI00391BD743
MGERLGIDADPLNFGRGAREFAAFFAAGLRALFQLATGRMPRPAQRRPPRTRRDVTEQIGSFPLHD